MSMQERPFLPPQLMNPMMGGMSFPAVNKLPQNPNPLAKAAPAHTVRADAAGIQEAMAKRGASLGLGNVPQGTGPQQMFNAMTQLGQAKALVDPTETLQKERLSRGDFEGKLDELVQRKGDKYNFSEMRKDPKTHAILKGLLGAVAGGGVGYLGGGGGIGSTLAGAAIGGAGGAGIGALGAKNENRKLHSTAKVLKNYGLLQPEYLRQALPLLTQSAQDNGADRLSASGENSGVTFKHDDQGHLTGADAFKTLDGYMKKAGMNTFQRQFFGRLIEQGMDETMIHASVKTAGDRFGEKVAADLNEGLELMEKSAIWSAAAKAVPWLSRQAGKLIPSGVKQLIPSGVKQVARKPGVAAKAFGRSVAPTVKAAPGAIGRTLKSTVLPGSREGAKRALGQMGTGAGVGAFNPYTGLGSGNIMTEDGFRGDRLLQSMAGGALLGRVPGAQGMMRRGMVGSSAGWLGGGSANVLGGLTGNEYLKNVDAKSLARLGFGASAATGTPGLSRSLSKIPGVRNIPGITRLGGKRLTNQMQHYDPYNIAMRGMGNTAKAMYRNPGKTLQYAGLGGMAATPAAVYHGLGNMQQGVQKQLAEAQLGLQDQLATQGEQYKDEALDQLHGYAQHYDKKLSPALDRVNQFLGTGEGGEGGGIGGMFGGLSNMMGGVGDYVKKNPWLIPLLLGGLGAGGGYALGGGGGAALGGLGVPLLYMLATGQLGNMTGGAAGGGQDNAASTAEVQRQAGENAKVTQDMQDPVARVQQQQPQMNEIQRQQQQQMAYA